MIVQVVNVSLGGLDGLSDAPVSPDRVKVELIGVLLGILSGYLHYPLVVTGLLVLVVVPHTQEVLELEVLELPYLVHHEGGVGVDDILPDLRVVVFDSLDEFEQKPAEVDLG